MGSPSLNAGLSILTQSREQENEFVADRLLAGYIFWVVPDESWRSPIFPLPLRLRLPLPLPVLSPNQNKRHLDRSNKQSYRPLRSGEIPVFRLCSCRCSFSPTQNKRHLDRSNGRSYRPLRSGEIPVFRLCPCRCSFSFAPPLHRHFDRS